VLGVVDAAAAATVDLDRVKIVKQVGGTVDDTELVDGIVFAQGAKKAAGGPTGSKRERNSQLQRLLSRPFFHSFRLIFGRAIISRNGLAAWMLFPERARAEHSR
jgi:hypothetical protein